MSDWKKIEPDYVFTLYPNTYSRSVKRALNDAGCTTTQIIGSGISFASVAEMNKHLAEEFGVKVLSAAAKGVGIVIESGQIGYGTHYRFYVRDDNQGVLIHDPEEAFFTSWLLDVFTRRSRCKRVASREEAITGRSQSAPAIESKLLDAKSIVKTALAFATRDYSDMTHAEFESGIAAGVDLEVVRLIQSALPAPRSSSTVAEAKAHVGIEKLRQQVDDIVTRKRPRYNVGVVGDGYVVFKDGKEMSIDEVLAELRRGAAAPGDRA